MGLKIKLLGTSKQNIKIISEKRKEIIFNLKGKEFKNEIKNHCKKAK